jgi:hypothetical protein
MNYSILKIMKKWLNRRLEDTGSYVSEEYRKFQKDQMKWIRKWAKDNGWILSKFSHGHYFESYFINNGDKYVYISHERIDRTFIDLDSNDFYLYRTAKDDKDYTGGTNHFCSWRNLEDNVNKLLN